MQLVREITEDIAIPSEGIFYYLRVPEGWILYSYRYADREPLDHTDVWPEVARIVASRWSRKVTESDDVKALTAKFMALRQGKGGGSSDAIYSKIKDLPYAFPRGRVMEVADSEFAVKHGNNAKSTSVSRTQVETDFGIAGKCKWELDLHEQVLQSERDEIRQILGIKDSWPAETY